MPKIYTHKVFYNFQDKMCSSLLYVIELKNDDANQCVYGVKKKNDGGHKVRKIVYDKSLDLFSCSCKKN